MVLEVERWNTWISYAELGHYLMTMVMMIDDDCMPSLCSKIKVIQDRTLACAQDAKEGK